MLFFRCFPLYNSMENKCKKCKEPALLNRKYCQKHLDYINLKAKERVGRCKQCSELAVEGKTRCAKHLEECKIKSKERKERLKGQNLCRDCGKPKNSKNKLCETCGKKSVERNKEKVIERQKANLCTCCGIKKENKEKAYCDSCIHKDRGRLKERRKERYNKMRCVRCNFQMDVKKYFCNICNIEFSIRRNIWSALKRRDLSKSASTEELLGCSVEFFREHMKNLMADWMNENNYGVHVPGERRWQIGHRLPVASFDLTKLEHQKKCWHYTNLFPQEACENIMLGDLMVVEGAIIRGRYYLNGAD